MLGGQRRKREGAYDLKGLDSVPGLCGVLEPDAPRS